MEIVKFKEDIDLSSLKKGRKSLDETEAIGCINRSNSFASKSGLKLKENEKWSNCALWGEHTKSVETQF